MSSTTASSDLLSSTIGAGGILESTLGSALLIDPLVGIHSSSTLGMKFQNRTEAGWSQTESNSLFTSGVFTVGDTGKVSIDYLFDGGSYQGQLAIFSLSGLDQFDVGSDDWIQEVARRALSNSVLGHVVISDRTDAAKFHSQLSWEKDFNSGQYLGLRTFDMQANDQFGIMLVPNGTVQEFFVGKTDSALRPLFSLVAANPTKAFHLGQIADVTGNGSTFVFEDLRMDGRSDRDYNDIIFQVRGAVGQSANLEDFINSTKDWRTTDVGKQLLDYAVSYEKSLLVNTTEEPRFDIPRLDDPQISFPKTDQPIIGIIDTGFNAQNPDIDYSRIILGRDLVDNDDNPLITQSGGNEHGTHILGIIGATQGNEIGIDGINDKAPIWLGRAVGSGRWAESLVEFVDAAKKSGQPNAIVNLSFDLTQKNPDGTITTRFEFTPQERQALEYARQNNVLIIAAAGNQGGTMSALGQASQEFDNIITVGAIDYDDQLASYSSFGYGLDLVAYGGTKNKPVLSTVGSGEDLKRVIAALNLQWENGSQSLDQKSAEPNIDLNSGNQVSAWESEVITGSNNSVTQAFGSSITEPSSELPADEMSIAAKEIFSSVFGEFEDIAESELDSLTPEEREVYEEATREIDQVLQTYLGEASQKLALEYVDGFYETQVNALSQFVEAFDENVAETLMQAQDILQEAGYATDLSAGTTEDLSLDLGLGTMAGTSIATARVTGIASQVWAANPKLSYAQIKEILKTTATDLGGPGWDTKSGAGKVNLAKSISLAQITQPETHQPQPIVSPLIWSGQDKVLPSERPVWYSVPAFTGRIMNAGYVNQVGFLRIRSGPGTNFAEVGRLSPGSAVNFDAVENNGAWVPDPYMPGGGSRRWYRIAGTNNWMSGLYFDNSPEQAEQERQRLEAIRQAEEEARRAEEAMRRAEEEARQAEEELRRIEAEQRRIEEDQRLKREQFQAVVNAIKQKHGDPGLLLGSWISNGVSIYQFSQGQLLTQPDGRMAFYSSNSEAISKVRPEDLVVEQFIYGAAKQAKSVYRTGEWVKSNIVDPAGFSKNLLLLGLNPVGVMLPPDIIGKSTLSVRNLTTSAQGQFLLEKIEVLKPVAKYLDEDIIKLGGKAALKRAPLIDLALTVGEAISSEDDKERRRAQLKLAAMGIAGAVGGAAGLAGFGVGAVPLAIAAATLTGTLMDLAYTGIDLLGQGETLDRGIENSFNTISSAYNATIDAVRKKAEEAQQKARELAEKAKTIYQSAQATVQQAKVAYQAVKQEIAQRTSQIVQQAKQKMQEATRAVAQKVLNNPVVRAVSNVVNGAVRTVSRVVNHVATYARRAVQAVTNVINGAKQFISNVIETGKQIVNNVVETAKKTYQEVKTFVAEKVEQGKQFAAEQYNRASQAVNNTVNAVSNGFNGLKSMFGW